MTVDIFAAGAGIPDLAYGSTSFISPNSGNPAFLDQKLLNELVAMAGQGVWLRYQLQWLSIETSYTKNTDGTLKAVYDWSRLDDAVQKCNASGVNMCWNIQSPPSWRQTLDPATGKILPGNGTTCNTNLTQKITAGVTPNPAADGNAVLVVTALGAGDSLTTGQQIGLGLNRGQQEVEDVLSTGNYGPGATQIKVTDTKGNIWIPQNTFGVGAAVYNDGAVLEGPVDTTQFAKDVATRYNGQSGHGFIPAIQVGNEEFDSYAPRDDQGKWLAMVARAAAPAIRAASPTCRIGVCAVRKTPKQGLAHVQAWMTNLYTYQGGVGNRIDWLDFHYYRGGSTAGPDPDIQDKDTPSVATEVQTMQSIANQNGQSPEIWCAETGWDIYDGGQGDLLALSTGVTPGGGPYTSLAFTKGLKAFTPSGQQLFVDYGNTNQETVYVWANTQQGTAGVTISTSATAATQQTWTPQFSHAAGTAIYIPDVPLVNTAAAYAQYMKEMYDALRTNGASKCFVYTLGIHSAVNTYTGTGVGPNAVFAGESKSIAQIIGGTYTRLAPFTMTQAYAQKYPTWTGSSTGGTNQDVLASRFNLQSPARNRRLFSRFNLQLTGVTQAKRLLSARYKLLSINKQLLLSRFNLQGASTSRIRLLASRYRLRGVLATLILPGRIKLLPGSTIALPPPPDALPSFFTAPTTTVRFGIGTYQSLPGSATTTIDGGFHFQPGAVFHPYAGNYGGTYGYLLDTTIKQPQQTQYTPATEIGLDASGVSVVRGFPQITWSYTTMRPDYWYYLQQVFRQSGKAPPGFQYLVLIQYPSSDGSNTAVQQLARMNPPTFNYRSVAAFYGVSLLFQYVNAAQLAQTVPIVLLSP